uniref:PPM-type phosphatase domain-containing protein n=1 Tax=Ciona savignyi TaxID=51511 RepID=H2ZPH6_CIOSA
MNSENVFVSCPVCQANMTLAQLNGHQTHHKALKTLKFKQEGPGSSEVLLKRRRLMVKRIVSKYKENPGKEGLLERIDKLDTSFDVVQANLHRGMSLLRTLEPHIERPSLKEGSLRHEPEDLNSDIQSNGVWEGLPNCIAAIGTCEAMNIDHRDTMEDRTLIKPEFLSHATPKEKSDSCCYIGLYDGHHGQAAVTHTNQLLHSYIEQEIDRMSESSHNDEENLDPDEILNKLNNVKISTHTGDTCDMPQSSN